jgi:hypothetical protein
MRLRRFLGLLTSVAMLHLSVAAGEAACAPQAAGGHHPAASSASAPSTRAPGAVAMERHSMPAVVAPVVDAAHGAQVNVPPCEVPAVQHCCDALVGCGIAGGVAGERRQIASSVHAAGRVHDAPGDAPASFAPAPEPPPPKA